MREDERKRTQVRDFIQTKTVQSSTWNEIKMLIFTFMQNKMYLGSCQQAKTF